MMWGGGSQGSSSMGGGGGGFSGNSGGGGRRGGGGRGNTFRGRGRRGGGRDNGGGGRDLGGISGGGGGGGGGEPSLYSICSFFLRDGSCRFNDQCRNSHSVVSVAMTIPAHEQSVKTLAHLAAPDAPRLLSGSMDGTVKVWNLGVAGPTPEISIPTPGPVNAIEVNGNNIMWSDEEPLANDAPGVPVAVVHLLNTANMSTVAIKRSDQCPYSHPLQVRDFKIVINDSGTFVVTAGGEGLIRTWKYDTALGKFEHLSCMEGHTRAVTCLLLFENFLWSGSTDRTIRVWDIMSGGCLGVLSCAGPPGAAGPGHTEAVSCLELIPPQIPPGAPAGSVEGGEAFIASGGADGEVKLWRPNGEFVHAVSHGAPGAAAFVTKMKYFKDNFGGQAALIIAFLDGSIILRSCLTMDLLFSLDGSFHGGAPVWSIATIPDQSCFASAGDAGSIIVWRIGQAL